MSLHYTNAYQLAYAGTDTALNELADVTQQVATTLDDALARIAAPLPSTSPLLPLVNAADPAYGAAADGTGDQTDALQAAAVATPAGGVLWIPQGTFRILAPVVIPAGVTVAGHGTIAQAAAGQTALVLSSGCRVQDVTVTGPGGAASSGGSVGISAVGSLGGELVDVHLRNVTVRDFGQHGIFLKFVNRFSVRGCTVRNMWYSGVMMLSCAQGVIADNLIDTVAAPTLAYGIAMTKDEAPEAYAPRTSDVTVAGNVVRNVAGWEGIDTHGGRRITIAGNTVYGCMLGISAVSCPAGPTDVNGTYAPLDVTITGNTVDSGVSDGSKNSGIVLAGAATGTAGTVTEYATGTITGNTIRGHGSDTLTGTGAMYLHTTRALTVTGNVMIEPSAHGIALYHDNIAAVVLGNTIVEPWSAAQSVCSAIYLRSDAQKVTVAHNRHVASGSKAGSAKVNDRGLYVGVSSPTNLELIVAGNYFAGCTTPFAGGAAYTKMQFGQAAPAAKPAAPGTATGTDATVINSLVSALRTLGLVT